MIKRRGVLALVILSLLLAACAGDSTLNFNNKTECGTATITLTNTESGAVEEYTLDEGQHVSIKVDNRVQYHYEIEYAGRPGSSLKCESKSAIVEIPTKGQDANISLTSVTPTPASP